VCAIFRNLQLGLIIGFFAVVFIYFQPFLSDICLKNTAKALKLEDIVLAEGKVTYFSPNQEIQGKLYLTKKHLAFVFNNEIDFIFPVEKIIKIKEEIEGYDQEIILELNPLLERKFANLPQIAHMITNLACLSKGVIFFTVEQSIFNNEFALRVTNPSLWANQVFKLRSRAQ
jgi:hypothetical protein